MMNTTWVKNYRSPIIKHNFFLRNRKREDEHAAKIVQWTASLLPKDFARDRPDKLWPHIKNTRCFQRNYQAVRDWRLNNNASKFTQFKKPKDKTNITGYSSYPRTSPLTITPPTCTYNINTDKNRGKRGAKNKSKLAKKMIKKNRKRDVLAQTIPLANVWKKRIAATHQVSYYRSLNKNIVIISSIIKLSTPSRTSSS